MLKDVLAKMAEENETSLKENKEKEKDFEDMKESKYIKFPLSEIEKKCDSSELFELIHKNNFNILEYKRLMDKDIDETSFYCDFDECVEKYLVSYNNWQFEINNLHDVDIEEGIFAVYSITNMNTKETVYFYVDLGCRNTGVDKFNRFMKLLSCSSEDEYIEKQYGLYLDIPQKLKELGYPIDDKKFNFKDISKRGISLLVNRLENNINIYLNIFESIYDEIHMVVTNDAKWDVNSSNRTLSENRAYYIHNYDGDINTIVTYIEAFKEHMKGHIGFLCPDGTFFRDKDIFNLSHKLLKQIRYEDWNTYQFKSEYVDIYDCRGYSEENLMPNKLDGLEMYSILKITFNDASQWSKGNTALELVFVFKYDKKEDPNNISLHVYGIKIDNKTGEFEFESKEKKEQYENDERWLKEEWKYAKLCIDDQIIGSKEDVLNSFYDYLKECAKSFKLENTFGTEDFLRYC